MTTITRFLAPHSQGPWMSLFRFISTEESLYKVRNESVQREMCTFAGSHILLQHFISINVPQVLFNGDIANSATVNPFI